MSTPGDATWLHTFFPDQFWANQGGDFDPTVRASQSVGTCPGPCDPVVAHTWGSTPQMVADIQGWLDNPPTNFGWLLLGDEGASNSAKRFASRVFANQKHWPMFNVEFSPPPLPTADITGPGGEPDGCVDAFDLGAMLGAWCSAVNDPNPPSPPCENCTSANLAVADISGASNVPDGCVDAFDLAKLLAEWCSVAGGIPVAPASPRCETLYTADFDGDGTVGILDLLALLANWGPCP
ncbi:MAG: hypothetical protein IH830_12290 [Planctomycetes bacterium]|nr:hypothetical protein [Planctomycetota bacterium]